MISDLHTSGTTIFLTTHCIEEAERLCGRIAFVVSGRIVGIDTVEDLLQPLQSRHDLQIACANGVPDLVGKLTTAFPELNFQVPAPGVVRVESDAAIRVGSLVRLLEEQGVEVREARRLRPSLEDVPVRITGLAAGARRIEMERTGGGL